MVASGRVDDDLFLPSVVDNPHPLLARLREEDPVHWSERHRAWLLTRYDDVSAGFRDERFSAQRILPALEHWDDRAAETVDPVTDVLANWMVFKDPPDHPRLRRLVSTAFRPRAIAALRPDIEATVDMLVEDLVAEAAADSEGVVDLNRVFAGPLPAIVIANMLGVPAEDRDRFRHWSDELSDLVFGATEVPDRRERGQRALAALAAYFGELIERSRSDPQDNVMGSLIESHDEGDHLSADELISTCTLLLFGGHETTTALITNGMAALLASPAQIPCLVGGETEAARAVEELLRFEGPAKFEVRHAVDRVELHDKVIERGQRIFLSVISANRDPTHFADPDRLDLTRSPNPHLGFGFGAHFCLGAALARTEGRIALSRLLKRFPHLAPAVPLDSLPWRPALISRSLSSLPVTLGPR
jgi:cytochrome P450